MSALSRPSLDDTKGTSCFGAHGVSRAARSLVWAWQSWVIDGHSCHVVVGYNWIIFKQNGMRLHNYIGFSNELLTMPLWLFGCSAFFGVS